MCKWCRRILENSDFTSQSSSQWNLGLYLGVCVCPLAWGKILGVFTSSEGARPVYTGNNEASKKVNVKVNVKIRHLYSTSSEVLHFWSAQHGSHNFLHCKYTMPPLPRSSPGGATTEWTVITPADAWSLLLIYRPREDERLSWPCWLTYSRRFTHQLQVRCRPVKVRRSETDVLSHSTNWVASRWVPLMAAIDMLLMKLTGLLNAAAACDAGAIDDWESCSSTHCNSL